MDREDVFPIVNPVIGQTSAAPNLKFNEKVKELMKSGREIAHFAFGQSPFPIADCLVKALRQHAGKHAYLPMKGIPELREALKDFHEKYDGFTLDVENLIVGPGSKELIFHIMRSFNGVILITSPTWSTYAQQSHLAEKQSVVLELNEENGWKITSRILNKGMTCLNPETRKGYKLLIMTNPGNPTGTRYTQTELEDIRNYCRANKIIVLSDEIYARLAFDRRHESIFQLYPEGTILTSGLSKWASAGGWRLGYAHFPSTMKSLQDAVESSASNTYSCAPAPMQYAVAMALKEFLEELEQYLEHSTSVLKLIGDFCYEELSSVGVTGWRSEAGYYYMPNFEVIREPLRRRGIKTGRQMTDAMLTDINVALMASELFLRPEDELSVRFCFVCFDGEKVLRSYEEAKKNHVDLRATSVEGQNFVKTNCETLAAGICRLKQWIIDLKNSQ